MCEEIDCPECQGTGRGYSHEPHSCGRCAGRGYLFLDDTDAWHHQERLNEDQKEEDAVNELIDYALAVHSKKKKTLE